MISSSNPNYKENAFLLSAVTEKNPYINTNEVIPWLNSFKFSNQFSVEQIPFTELEEWYFEKVTGNLVHTSGKFFKICGIRVSTNFGPIEEWEQPIIDQSEIGILGIICKNFKGGYYFLMQAKMEPGNVNTIQIGPTVQATRSNYTQVHKGKLPLYLDYFLQREKSNFLIDQLQSEQGCRFLKKRNRNMIVEINDDIKVHDGFCWLTLGQIKELLKVDNIVNMDARSILSSISFLKDSSRAYFESSKESANIDRYSSLNGFAKDVFVSTLSDKEGYHDCDGIISWVSELKTKYKLNVATIPLRDVSNWIRTEKEIIHESKRFFSVIAVSVEAQNREITRWTQPIVKSPANGLLGFITKKNNNVLHFLIQAKMEPGNFDIIDLAPTVSCSEVELRMKESFYPPFLDLFMNADPKQIRYSAVQSEEGGRFFHFQNKNIVIEIDAATNLEIPENYIWMTLGQIQNLLKHGYFNMDARSILSYINLLSPE
jgi:dTDP-4-dehydro-6-deoxy-alpha-D-glucopyranose 2,3-dehydratase